MKKVLALALASVMALGMATTAFAAEQLKGLGEGYNPPNVEVKTTNSTTGVIGFSAVRVSDPSWNPAGTQITTSGHMTTVNYGTNVVPNAKVDDYVYLLKGMFMTDAERTYTTLNTVTNQDQTVMDPANMILTAQDIRNLKLTIRTSTRGGSQAIDSISLDNRKGFVKIKYARELVRTDGVDFEVTIYAVLDGRRQDDYSITFIGTIENEVTEVYGDYDSVDTSAGQVAEAMEFNSNIEVELGNGVVMHTKFFKGKKYYGTASRDPDDAADVVFKKYPDVDNVVILKTVGLNSTGDIVKLDVDYSDYYVYNANMEYIGQSNQMLPYSTRYYLANRKLDVTDDSDAEEGDAPEDGSNPETGGDGSAASNANANPGTGR